ncbi:hypothetical protein NFI96_020863 [Prochilodus magdalenae]|nr:hypothetical protein NFI96_020863 [Prochilodus magdalenae]
MAKKHAEMETNLPALTDSMKRDIHTAFEKLLENACGRQLTATLWLLGFFYKVLSPEKGSVKHQNFKWIANNLQCQTELPKVVKCYREQLQQHSDFADFVHMDMFSVEKGDPKVLKYLGRSPLELLNVLMIWVQTYQHPVSILLRFYNVTMVHTATSI